MRGPQRVIVFCLLTTVVPTALLVTPLYLRFFWFAEVVYAVADSDVIVADKGISSFWCQNQSLQMNSTFNAYLVEGQLSRSDVQKTVAIRKHLVLADDTLEWIGFYLLKGSRVNFAICSRYEGARIMVVSGARNLKQCALLEKGPLLSIEEPGHELEYRFRVQHHKEETEQNGQERKEEKKEEIHEIGAEDNDGAEVKKDLISGGHFNVTRKVKKKKEDFKQMSHVTGNEEERENYIEVSTEEMDRRVYGVNVTGLKEEKEVNDGVNNFNENNDSGKKDDNFVNLVNIYNKSVGGIYNIDSVHKGRIAVLNQTSDKQSTDRIRQSELVRSESERWQLTQEPEKEEQLTVRKSKGGVRKESKRNRRKERRNKRKKGNDKRKLERQSHLHRRNRTEHEYTENAASSGDAYEPKLLRIRHAKIHENNRKTQRSQDTGNEEDLEQLNTSNPVISRSTNLGTRQKRQMQNDTTDIHSRSLVSSFEQDLFTCYKGSIIFQGDYPPSPLCSNDYLENSQGSSLKQTSHEIPADGYYYYIFYSDNEIVKENDIYVNFKLEKVIYEWENSSYNCVNKTYCNFLISFMSEEKVLLEIPVHDGISSDEEAALLLHSVCEPRMAVYMMFPLAVLLMILVSAFQ